jgi:hypothetical protein
MLNTIAKPKSTFESFISNMHTPLVNPNNIQISVSHMIPMIPTFLQPMLPVPKPNQYFNTLVNQSISQPFGPFQMNQLISSQNNLMNIPNNLLNTSENFLYIVYEF